MLFRGQMWPAMTFQTTSESPAKLLKSEAASVLPMTLYMYITWIINFIFKNIFIRNKSYSYYPKINYALGIYNSYNVSPCNRATINYHMQFSFFNATCTIRWSECNRIFKNIFFSNRQGMEKLLCYITSILAKFHVSEIFPSSTPKSSKF